MEGISYHPTAWDCLRLDFASTPEGLESVFAESAKASYSRLFNLLLTVRRTEHALNTAWNGAKRTALLDPRSIVLHHQMAFIVSHLNSYLQVCSTFTRWKNTGLSQANHSSTVFFSFQTDVIASAFERLLKAFNDHQSSRDLGCVEALHEAFLLNMESQALLHHHRLRSILLRLLNVCRRYQSMDLSTAIAAFEHLAGTLFSALTAAAAATSTSRLGGGGGANLSQLLLRLDYNYFFSKSLPLS